MNLIPVEGDMQVEGRYIYYYLTASLLAFDLRDIRLISIEVIPTLRISPSCHYSKIFNYVYSYAFKKPKWQREYADIIKKFSAFISQFKHDYNYLNLHNSVSAFS